MANEAWLEKYVIGTDQSKVCDNFPAKKFLDKVNESMLFWTPNNKQYFLMTNQTKDDYSGREYIATAVVTIGFAPNTYFPIDQIRKSVLHIDWLATNENLRGTGALSLIAKLLIEYAEETGVCIIGHSRPFNIQFPTMSDTDVLTQWAESVELKMEPSLKKDKENAKKLLKSYRQHGFCKYDGTGLHMDNRFWKSMAFGYCSTNMKDKELLNFYQNHMTCI